MGHVYHLPHHSFYWSSQQQQQQRKSCQYITIQLTGQHLVAILLYLFHVLLMRGNWGEILRCCFLINLSFFQDSYQCRDGVQCNFLHNISNQKGLLNKCFNSDISLSELLLEFFQFYANYNFTTNALCPVSGTSIVKTRRWKNSATIDLINPLEKDLNVREGPKKQ